MLNRNVEDIKKAQVKLEIKTVMSKKNNSGMGLRVH